MKALPIPAPIDRAHGAFRRWLGEEYDIDALDATLAAAAALKLDGDPLWLQLISGSGNAKTETVQALSGAGAIVTSTISSIGALLSATSTKEKTKDATGGLLRRIGTTGVLVLKDMTSILSMQRDARAEVLAALREVYDGKWERNTGTDGGKTLTWQGRIVVVAAVTTAWDAAHGIISAMGDRFVLLRLDSTTGRLEAGRRAISNTGHEEEMRQHLADAVAVALGAVDPAAAVQLTTDETEAILRAANIVTLCRTAVDFDFQGKVQFAHAPEMPTRFAKQLTQVVRGACAIGLPRAHAVRLAIRCARDSMPPLRLAILEDVAAHPHTRTGDVRRRIEKPRSSVDRQLQALHELGVLTVDEVEHSNGASWYYSLAEGINSAAISCPTLSVDRHSHTEEAYLPPDISGQPTKEAEHASDLF